jgi:hypothetical protein
MKQNILKLSLIIALLGCTTTSCDLYKTAESATSIGQLKNNPFLQNVAKRLISDVGNMLIQQGMQKAATSLNLKTPLNSILSTATAITGFKNLLSGTYKVPTNLVDANFSKLTNLGSVVSFLGSNSNFNF